MYPTTSPRRGLSRRTTLAAFGVGAFAVTVTGCKSGTTSPQARPSAATIGKDALGPVYTETLTLITTYDTAITNNPALVGLLGPLRDDHRQHAVALAALMGIAAPAIRTGPDPSGTPMPPLPSPPLPSPSVPSPSVPPSGSPSAPPSPPSSGAPTAHAPTPAPTPGPETAPARAQLSAVEKTAATNVTNACLNAPADRVAVLASIVACRATHVAALR